MRSRVRSVAFAPDGQTLAPSVAMTEWCGCGTCDQPEATPVVLARVRMEQLRARVAFAPDGQTLASGTSEGIGGYSYGISTSQEAAPRASWRVTTEGSSASPSPRTGRPWPQVARTGPFAYGTCANRTAAPTVLRGHEDSVSSVAISSDGADSGLPQAMGQVRLWDLG